MTEIDKIERNDLDAVAAFYQERGSVTEDEYDSLMKLQDNWEAFDELTRDWKVSRSSLMYTLLL